MREPDYKDNLLNFDLKSFLEKYSDKDILKLRANFPETYQILAAQIKLYPKARLKLPLFTDKYCYFTTKSYEQSSSMPLAEFKAKKYRGNILIDLTGGLGADDAAFSGSFKQVISIDNDKELNKLARINFGKLGLKNIKRLDDKAEEYIKNDVKADLIYIDADRRSSRKKTVTLEDSSPNILKILDRLPEISPEVLLKLSPLIDITYLVKTLPALKEIYAVSLDNEVKEIFACISKGFTGKTLINAVDISGKDEKSYSSYFGDKAAPKLSQEGKYFYEPSRSLIKSGLVNSYAESSGLNTISSNGVFMTGNDDIKEFFGRKFKVTCRMLFGKSAVKKYLSDKNILQANIAERNFPVSADELKKLFKIKDGGSDYLFFTTADSKEKLFFHCIK